MEQKSTKRKVVKQMAGRPRKPAKLLEAEGKSHMSKSELQDRKDAEIQVPFTDVKAPSYLNKNQKKKFNDIAKKLLAIGIMTELDVDCLAMYVMAYELYVSYTEELAHMIETNSLDLTGMKEMQSLQDKAFRQAHTAAKSLCLTITDRCKVTVPPPPDGDDDEL